MIVSRNNERFFKNAAEGIFQITPKGRYISVNPAFARIVGYDSPDEMINTVTDIQRQMYVHQYDNTRLIKLFKNQAIVNNFEAEVRRRDGSIIWTSMNASPVRDKNGKTVLLEGTIVDITTRKRADDALHISETQYRRLFESAQDGILILDAITAQIIDVNPFLIAMLGYSKDELLGRKLWEVGSFQNHKAAMSAFATLQSRQYIRYEDMPLQTKDGNLINVEFISNVYMVDGARVIQCNIRDISTRKRSEEALKQSQQQELQIRDQFLSRMSHELRSPLTPIYQFVTILLDGLAGDLNAEQLEYLLIILRNVNSLRAMVSDLLSVTRAVSGKLNIDPCCIYLTELIPKILKTCQKVNTKNLLLSFDIPGNLPPVLADPDRVRQILDNLLDNAIKSTPEKGEISIRVRASTRSPEFIRIAVTDTGCGMAQPEHKKIFEYLYQVEDSTDTSRKGLGIGLYICRELVSSHGGRIWVKSQPGQGSTFIFTLPVFSLERQLASIVKATNLITHSIALITVEVSHVEKAPLKRKPYQAALEDTWNVLQSCTLPNSVVLLPRVPHKGSKDFFFIVARVNQSSAEVLVEQLRNRLARWMSLRKSMLNPKVSFVLLDTRSKRKGNLSRTLANKNIVNYVRHFIKATLHKEGVPYE